MRLWAFILALALLSGCNSKSVWGAKVQQASVDELSEIAPQGQLSRVATPLAYDVTLLLDPRQPRFSGEVAIDVQTEVALTGLWMHGDDLDVSEVTVTAGGETRPATWTEVLDTGVVWVGFPNRLKQGRLRLDISYSAPFDANLAGLFRVDEQGHAYALAKSESIQARRFLPSFDEPGFKAPFTMHFTVPEGMHAIANTPETDRVAAGAGYETISFLPTRPLSTYLLSVAVGSFDKVEAGVIPPNALRDYPVPLTGYARAGKGEELNYILSITPALVEIFEDSLQQPYPYKKLDIVAAPQWPSGATELAGAITYRESRILKGSNAGPAFVRGLKEVHAHEIAHMWFGNLVTPPWWNDLWLKEGFATWSEPMALSQFEPDEGHEVEAVVASISAMQLDSLGSARAISEPIDRNEDIRNAYDAITYRKSLGVIGMVDAYFGAETFRPALGDYIAAYADEDADSEAFFDIIGETTGEPNLTEVFQSFVAQNGVPLVTAKKVCSAGGAKVELSQRRYAPVSSGLDMDRKWVIPICVSWLEGDYRGRSCMLMKNDRAVLALQNSQCPGVVIPNADGAGYYRFTLDEEGWDDIIPIIASLPPTEALATIDSAFAAWEAAEMRPEQLLELLSSAAQHADNRVIAASMSAGTKLYSRVEDTSASERARNWLTQMVFSASSGPGYTDENVELRALLQRVRASYLEDRFVRGQLGDAMARFIDTKGEGGQGLSSDLFSTALTIALQDNPEITVARVLQARAEIDDPVFEQAIASALGNVTDVQQATEVRELIANGALGPRETYTLALLQTQHDETREAMWEQITADLPAFLDVIPGQWRRRTPRLGEAFCDTARIDEITQLMEQHADAVAGYERALNETIESIERCEAQMLNTTPGLITAFETY